MKIVGLTIDKDRVSATVVEKGMRQSELKDSFALAYSTEEELAGILKEKAADWAGARIVVSLPGRLFSQRLARLPFFDRKRVEKALPFEIEESLPFDLDDMELDHLVLDQEEKGTEKKKEFSILGFLLPKAVLRQHLGRLASAGLDPQVVIPSSLGLYQVARMIPIEGTAVLIHGSDLCVKSGNAILSCRSFSDTHSSGGIGHTLKAIELESGMRVEKACLLSENGPLSAELTGLGIAVEQITPAFWGKKAADPVSLGVALSEQVNFRKNEFAYRLADAGNSKRKRTLIIAGVLAALFAIANLGVKYYLVQASYGKLDREIRETYRQAFPDAKSVADPVRQLRTKLDEARKKYGVLGSGTSALEVMKAVTEGIPREIRVSFQEFNLEGDSLKLQGEAASFEAVDKMKAELQKSPLFSDVAVLDTRMGVDNKVKFRFEIRLKQQS